MPLKDSRGLGNRSFKWSWDEYATVAMMEVELSTLPGAQKAQIFHAMYPEYLQTGRDMNANKMKEVYGDRHQKGKSNMLAVLCRPNRKPNGGRADQHTPAENQWFQALRQRIGVAAQNLGIVLQWSATSRVDGGAMCSCFVCTKLGRLAGAQQVLPPNPSLNGVGDKIPQAPRRTRTATTTAPGIQSAATGVDTTSAAVDNQKRSHRRAPARQPDYDDEESEESSEGEEVEVGESDEEESEVDWANIPKITHLSDLPFIHASTKKPDPTKGNAPVDPTESIYPHGGQIVPLWNSTTSRYAPAQICDLAKCTTCNPESADAALPRSRLMSERGTWGFVHRRDLDEKEDKEGEGVLVFEADGDDWRYAPWKNGQGTSAREVLLDHGGGKGWRRHWVEVCGGAEGCETCREREGEG